jgi:peroxiredoxin Q/BCP
MKKILVILFGSLFLFGNLVYGIVEGESIPSFELKNQKGELFKSSAREGKWTVFYFYPKASTPGCTKQACAFRDHLNKIRDLKAEVFGISVDTVADQEKFHKKEKLNFDLLADSEGQVSRSFGVKSQLLPIAKRWTFIVDPKLKVRWIGKDVDPALDALNVEKALKDLQKL